MSGTQEHHSRRAQRLKLSFEAVPSGEPHPTDLINSSIATRKRELILDRDQVVALVTGSMTPFDGTLVRSHRSEPVSDTGGERKHAAGRVRSLLSGVGAPDVVAVVAHRCEKGVPRRGVGRTAKPRVAEDVGTGLNRLSLRG